MLEEASLKVGGTYWAVYDGYIVAGRYARPIEGMNGVVKYFLEFDESDAVNNAPGIGWRGWPLKELHQTKGEAAATAE